jgi:hypothetical protein
MTLKIEYLGEFEIKFEKALGFELGTRRARSMEKPQVENIAFLSL